MIWLTLAHAWEAQPSDFAWQAEALDHAWELNTASFPTDAGSEDDLEQAFLVGLALWETAEAGLRLPYDGRFTGSVLGLDGQLQATWSAGPANDDVVATATSWATTDGHTLDCDIQFWGANASGDIDWGSVDLVDTTSHEVGHCLGLAHSAVADAQMAPFLRGHRGLHPDDLDGIRALYGHCPDGDGDGFTPCDNDCDDANALVHPNATETCDGVDNDCDLRVDGVLTDTATFGTGSSRFSHTGWGNAYTVSDATVLHTFAQHLDLADGARLTWSVLTSSNGSDWTRVMTHTERVDAGIGWFASPRFDLPLTSGEHLLLLTGVEGAAVYAYSLGLGGTLSGLTPDGVIASHAVPADELVDDPDGQLITWQQVTLSSAASGPDLCAGGGAPGGGSSSGGSSSGGSTGTTPPSGGSSGGSCGSCAGPVGGPAGALVLAGGAGFAARRRRR